MGESLKVTTAYDGSAIEAGLRKSAESTKKFGDSLKGRIFGAFSAGALAGQFTSVISGLFDRVNELSDQKELFGMSAESIQVLGKAAHRVGLEIDGLSQSLNALTNLRAAAIGGDQAAIEKLQKYGLTIKDINDETEDSVDLIKKMGQAMERMGNGAVARAGMLQDFGRGGTKIGAIARELGSSDIKPNFSEEKVQQLEESRKEIASLWAYVKSLGTRAIGQNLMDIKTFANIIAPPKQEPRDFSAVKDIFSAATVQEMRKPKLNLGGAMDSGAFRINALQSQGAFVGANTRNNTGERQLRVLESIDKKIPTKSATDTLHAAGLLSPADLGIAWP